MARSNADAEFRAKENGVSLYGQRFSSKSGHGNSANSAPSIFEMWQ